VPETTLTCPACGKTGTVTKKLTGGRVNATMLLMEGLNPEGCDGCRETLNSRGYAVVNATPAGPGAWTLTPAE